MKKGWLRQPIFRIALRGYPSRHTFPAGTVRVLYRLLPFLKFYGRLLVIAASTGAAFVKILSDSPNTDRACSPGDIALMPPGEASEREEVRNENTYSLQPPAQHLPVSLQAEIAAGKKYCGFAGPYPAGVLTFQSILIDLPRENLTSRTPCL